MEETLMQLEMRFEEALRTYIDEEGSENEAVAYRELLETFEAIKTFETEQESVSLTA
jgi:hypothetical protein